MGSAQWRVSDHLKKTLVERREINLAHNPILGVYARELVTPAWKGTKQDIHRGSVYVPRGCRYRGMESPKGPPVNVYVTHGRRPLWNKVDVKQATRVE